MNLTPNQPSPKAMNCNQPIRGSARTVWLYLRGVALGTNPPTLRFQVSRREIKEGTGIGSYNTIDEAVAALESFGLLRRHLEPGSNDGHQYELLSLEESPAPAVTVTTIISSLRQLADCVERHGPTLTGEQIIQ
ncbi:MAG TPA: hypothetical protein VF591_00045 [Pyrinomonadaceae bacterium]|jgi:DNA-binding HxlR family transcriptional regulator